MLDELTFAIKKSKNKKVQIELDALRNQGLDDELEIPDDLEDSNFTL